MPRVIPFVAGAAIAATVCAGTIVGSAAWAGPSSEPVATVGPGELSRDVAYQCAVTAAGLYLGIQDFTFAATADYPEIATPGDVLPARPLSVTLSASELLRQSTALLLGARASSAAGDAALSLTTGGRTVELEPTTLVFPRSDIPQAANEPWTMSGEGTIPVIAVPQDAAGALWVGLPAKVRIDTTLFTADDSTIQMTADCAAVSDRLLGGVALSGETDPQPPVLEVPDPPTGPTPPPPTDDPSTSPTDEPTTDPVPGSGGPIEVGPGTLSRTAAYRCAVNAAGLDLGVQAFTLSATADFPETVQPGDVPQARPVSVRWTANELLRQATASLLGAREARAVVRDAAWSSTTAGRTTELQPTALDFPRSRVPQTTNHPWTMDGVGMIPAVTAPQDAAGASWVGLPATFRVDVTLFKADEATIPFVANCAAGRDRLLGGIALAGETDPTPPVLDEPDAPTFPTIPPPTDTPPTGTPSTSTVPPSEPGGSAPVGPGEVSRVLPYRCEVVSGGLALGAHDVTVRVSTYVPGATRPGAVLASRPLTVAVNLPELLRQSTVLLLGARETEAEVTGTTLSLTSNERTSWAPLGRIRFPRSPVPQEANAAWALVGDGEIPAIAVPDDAKEVLWVGMPADLRIDTTVYKADGSTIPTSMDCAGPQDRLFGGVLVDDSPPTIEPTSEPTTQPTVDPTTQPTAPALIQPTVKVGALGLYRSAVFTVGVSVRGALPTGTVVVKRGGEVVAKSRLFLGVSVLTAGRLPRGEHAFAITYEGDAKVAAKTVTRKLRIF